METDELIKLVDGIYKNILEKFNPGARQMINAGKTYLKALHGAATASRLYVDAIIKLARQAQQGTWGSSSDIGSALMKVVEVYKDIQDQQMNILKAFYVDLLVPLETNLEKDTKVIQSEQKKFLHQHKQRSETFSKAAALMKKQRKKSKGSSKTGLAMDKELKNMQVLEEEKTKLDAFCEQSLKTAMTQERRRYGFVLERQCSVAKHYLAYYSHGITVLEQNLEKWREVAKTREHLPETAENIFSNKIKQVTVSQDEDLYSNPRSPNLEEDRMSISSQLRKTKSIDASCLDIRSADVNTPTITTLSRAKSDCSISSSTHTVQETGKSSHRPKSIAVSNSTSSQWEMHLARAMYAYLSSGENQLSFLEGDIIALMGERNKGWQFGENLRTRSSGWFPLSYTEILDDSILSPKHRYETNESQSGHTMEHPSRSSRYTSGESHSNNNTLDSSTPRMFGDTLHIHRSTANAKQIRRAIGSNVPPPSLPAPVPTPSLPFEKSALVQSRGRTFNFRENSSSSFLSYPQSEIKASPSYNLTNNHSSYSTYSLATRLDKSKESSTFPLHSQDKSNKMGGPAGNVSLHSSNDSGFSNDPPPQPEVDYSDEESIRNRKRIHSSRRPMPRTNNERKLHPIRSSNSAGNLTKNRFSTSDDHLYLLRSGNEKKGFVKRTKSFWKFGKGGFESEILEGMSLWKHKDLVEVSDDPATKPSKDTPSERKSSQEASRKTSRDRSNDSERTMLANERSDDQKEERKASEPVKKPKPRKQKRSFIQKQNHAASHEGANPEKSENRQDRKEEQRTDEFYDDGDGLLLKTVNRKNILQKYSDSIGSASESESEETSDPYDYIVVDDQMKKVRKNKEKLSNVAAIGKKLEKLSKTSKYPPGSNKNSNTMNEEETHRKNANEVELQAKENKLNKSNTELYNREEECLFKTFRRDESNVEEYTIKRNRSYRTVDRSNDDNELEERRKYYRNHQKQYNRMESDNRVRSSYESINSEVDQENSQGSGDSYNSDSENGNPGNFAEQEHRSLPRQYRERGQYLPRSKLSKTNSNNSNSRNDQEHSVNYEESLHRSLESPEHGTRIDRKSPHTGNLYGPWYNLWTLDSSTGNENIHMK